jgi:hypothetical protein
VKAYLSIWVLLGMIAAILFLTGNVDDLILAFLSLIGAGLSFIGMIPILPMIMEHEEKASIRTVVFTKQHARPSNI